MSIEADVRCVSPEEAAIEENKSQKITLKDCK